MAVPEGPQAESCSAILRLRPRFPVPKRLPRSGAAPREGALHPRVLPVEVTVLGAPWVPTHAWVPIPGGLGAACGRARFGICSLPRVLQRGLVSAAAARVSGEGFWLLGSPRPVSQRAPLHQRERARAHRRAGGRAPLPALLAPLPCPETPEASPGACCSQLCFPAGPKVLSHCAVSMETGLLAVIRFRGRGP